MRLSLYILIAYSTTLYEGSEYIRFLLTKNDEMKASSCMSEADDIHKIIPYQKQRNLLGKGQLTRMTT